MATRLVTAAAMLALGAAVAAQAPIPAPAPSSPHSGGFTPFRDGGFAGTSIDAAALEQPESPLRLSLGRADRDERGLTLSVRLENLTEGPSTRQVLGAWVIAPDGTVRGYQRFESKRAIAAGDTRTVEFIIRHATTNVVPGDVTIVAVQESAGAYAWRQDQASLQKAARAAVPR
jgi:hypothetical protein